MSRPIYVYRVEEYSKSYDRKAREFRPAEPDPPEGARGRWLLASVAPVQPGWVLCTWSFREDYTAEEELRNVRHVLLNVYNALAELFPKQFANSEGPGGFAVDARIMLILHQLVHLRARDIPQHVEKYFDRIELKP